MRPIPTRRSIGAGFLAALLLVASCGKRANHKKSVKPKADNKAVQRHPGKTSARDKASTRPLASKIKLSIEEVEALLKRAKPPKGGQVLALVYAGGIKGEIEPCG